jgi:hypothetical protein
MWQALAGETVTIAVSASGRPAKPLCAWRQGADAVGKYLPDLVIFRYTAIKTAEPRPFPLMVLLTQWIARSDEGRPHN